MNVRDFVSYCDYMDEKFGNKKTSDAIRMLVCRAPHTVYCISDFAENPQWLIYKAYLSVGSSFIKFDTCGVQAVGRKFVNDRVRAKQVIPITFDQLLDNWEKHFDLLYKSRQLEKLLLEIYRGKK